MSTPRFLKAILLAVLTAFLCNASVAVADDFDKSAPAIPIAAFGEDGDRVPDFVRDLLPEGFFGMSLTEAVANRQSYTALWRIPKSRATQQTELGSEAMSSVVEVPVRELKLRLVLTGDTARRNDVVISAQARGTGAARNFLVGVEPGEDLRLNADELAGFDVLYFLSLKPFSARLHARADGRIRSTALEVMEARRRDDAEAKSGAGYCSEVQRYVEICVTGTAACVTAWADRYEHGTQPGGLPYYFVDVDYPTPGDAFHVGYSSFFWRGTCEMTSYYTRNGDKRHRWLGLDDTLFFCDQSTALCTSGCEDPGVPDSFTVNCD